MPDLRCNPDYAVPPGLVLAEHLESRDLSVTKFSLLCGRTPAFIEDIISGKARLDRETALRFEKELGLSVDIWMGIEARYQEKRMRDLKPDRTPGMKTA